MRAVMLSVRPQWCELIANGKKTLEVRKTRPKLDTPFKVYIYCTQAKPGWFNMLDMTRLDGKVIGEYVCDNIEKFSIDEKYDNLALCRMSTLSCLSIPKLQGYATDYWLYGWHISDLKIYGRPKELSEFTNLQKAGNWERAKKVERAPQSWCYVEEAQDER